MGFRGLGFLIRDQGSGPSYRIKRIEKECGPGWADMGGFNYVRVCNVGSLTTYTSCPLTLLYMFVEL